MRETAIENASAAKVSEWLLAVLRFAVTLQPADRVAVMAMAQEIDRAGNPRVAFSFFAKTSAELCHAIMGEDGPAARAVLRAHLARIDDPRLRRAFEAAIARDWSPARSPSAKKFDRAELWKGLPDPRRPSQQ